MCDSGRAKFREKLKQNLEATGGLHCENTERVSSTLRKPDTVSPSNNDRSIATDQQHPSPPPEGLGIDNVCGSTSSTSNTSSTSRSRGRPKKHKLKKNNKMILVDSVSGGSGRGGDANGVQPQEPPEQQRFLDTGQDDKSFAESSENDPDSPSSTAPSGHPRSKRASSSVSRKVNVLLDAVSVNARFAQLAIKPEAVGQ